jgi:UDP-GlcNAc:undecaprenyl-phosphate GlcNAc-1-phosphate transferase
VKIDNWYTIFSYVLVESFVISLALTAVVRRIALRLDIVDHPGERKMHVQPIPLLGGVAIFLAFNLVIALNLFLLVRAPELGFDWLEQKVLSFLGENTTRPLIGVFAGGLIIFILGVVDDLVALKPELKLIGQIAAGVVLVASGVHVDLFLDNLLLRFEWYAGLPELTQQYVSYGAAGAISVFWVVLMTNSMNLLDNMDGLCGGISGIAGMSFFLCVLPQQEYFVSVLLMAFVGAVAGFLYHNLNPARIFMGDAGAMFCGYILATVSLLGTYYTESMPTRIAVAAPLLALCVPLFDTASVIYIRWRRGESIMKGDKRHFSHRLVELGMTSRQAVEFIFLVAGVTGLGGALLGQVGPLGTVVILAQTAGIFLLIILLMRAGKTPEPPRIEQTKEEPAGRSIVGEVPQRPLH